uniref:ATP synthase F0 subunit 8 n=1 Tax=Ptosima chinensis TaxID=3025998 RepID=UPI0023AB5107|nr:ATP synthase F0 subunit 8 [Ptosima chinensis]WCO87656.1 ATP synthase F0 subunit 8 [Ptosima chinensis]
MPQMAPLNWLILFLIFTATLIIVLAQNYPFTTMESSSQPVMKSTLDKINWKW